ncbi:PDZ domain-containing protein [Mucilaginibacter sp. Bleaf8]|uniref:S41 family peptidase n=1 Tax=Mucilaginibacter sp. Bleaf8 TaxID=2834430 RepID=UPI001BCF1EE6|nr:S41 family peptidase [Mucilaginibacter sp. Bleaf8]MBS7566951.1 PDZ domain-containing protein [Mucilaginibacter sp. Bleaf8]
MKKLEHGISSAFMIVIISLLAACKKENSASVPLSGSNQWILDSMRVYYYWNKELPKQPAANESPTSFFKSLLNPADRFSYIDNPDEVKTEYSSFAWYGFEYAFVESAALAGQLIGTVTLVVPGGPAEKQGLKRGDIFTAVNEVALSTSTSNSIKRVLSEGNGVTLQLADLQDKQLIRTSAVKITHQNFSEQPVYTTRIFSGGQAKIGYIFYNWFSGLNDYNVLDSLNKLKSQGISELVIDLRYNPGGDVSSAAKIAATLTPGKPEQLFAIYQANSNGGHINKSFNDLIGENGFQPQDFSEFTSRRINLKRIFILTSASTASAAELLVNNLKPFIQVIQIGHTTTGKDMASFAIRDFHTPIKINFTLHPLVFKLYNANGQGEYSNGLTPDYIVDEFSVLPLKPFSDPDDPLLKKALELAGMGLSINQKKVNSAYNALSSKPVYISKRSLPIIVNESGSRVKARFHN